MWQKSSSFFKVSFHQFFLLNYVLTHDILDVLLSYTYKYFETEIWLGRRVHTHLYVCIFSISFRLKIFIYVMSSKLIRHNTRIPFRVSSFLQYCFFIVTIKMLFLQGLTIIYRTRWKEKHPGKSNEKKTETKRNI